MRHIYGHLGGLSYSSLMNRWWQGYNNYLPFVMKNTVLILLFSLLFSGFKSDNRYDLAITNATILDVKSGKIYKNRSILIKEGRIVRIIRGSTKSLAAQRINAKGKLVTPSFIDTHIHPNDVIGEYDKVAEILATDSLTVYRKRLSDDYLPYGVTSTFSMGHRESWTQQFLRWQNRSEPRFADIFTSSAAITAKGTYVGHTFIHGEEQAREKVFQYRSLGLNYIKLYGRMSPAEFKTAFKTADSLGINVYAHIGDIGFDPTVITLPNALNIGVKNFEHIITLADAVMSVEDQSAFSREATKIYGPARSESVAIMLLMEKLRFADTYRKSEIDHVITKLAKQKATFSTTIHLLYKQFSDTEFTLTANKSLSPELISRCIENFRILMKYALLMQKKGVTLRIGTDTKNGGKALLSEMILLCRYGFSSEEAFKIATYNGARSMGIDQETGTIEKGKHANLLIWEENPLVDYRAIGGSKTIIKDGIAFNNTHAN